MSEFRTSGRTTNNTRFLRPKGEWREYKGGVYRCIVYLLPESDGRFSVTAARLPGVASQGDSEQQALANIVEAIKGAIAVYKEQGTSIPWSKIPVEPERGAMARCVIVHS